MDDQQHQIQPDRAKDWGEDPTGWFDQYPYGLTGIQGNDQWCARHWWPCPVFGANGIGASLELIRAWTASLVGKWSPDALNAKMRETGQLCCALGDERMYQLWGHWPPPVAGASTSLGRKPPKPGGA